MVYIEARGAYSCTKNFVLNLLVGRWQARCGDQFGFWYSWWL